MFLHGVLRFVSLDEMNRVPKPISLLFPQLPFCSCMICMFAHGKKKHSFLRIFAQIVFLFFCFALFGNVLLNPAM